MLYLINFCIIHKEILGIYKYTLLVFYSNNVNAAAFTDEIHIFMVFSKIPYVKPPRRHAFGGIF